MYEPYYLIVLEQLSYNRWINKKDINCDLAGEQLNLLFEELSSLHYIHLGVGNLLLSSKGYSYLNVLVS
jgi:hypothetical protein